MDSVVEGNILLVGDGDFSLTTSLLRYHSPQHITTTSLETESSILKHKDALLNRERLAKQGVQVLLDVDGCRLNSYPAIRKQSFQRIIFNFPHAGGKSNHKKNRKLLDDFFRSAVNILAPQGHVMVTLCKGQGGTPADRPQRAWPDSWQVVSMAANAGLILSEIHPFHPGDFPGYLCTGFRSQDKWFHIDGALTHMFTRAAPISVPKISDVPAISRAHDCQDKINRNLLAEPDHPLYTLTEELTDKLTKYWSTRVIAHGDTVGEVTTVNHTLDVLKFMLRDSVNSSAELFVTRGPVWKDSPGVFQAVPVYLEMSGVFRVRRTPVGCNQTEEWTSKLRAVLQEICINGQPVDTNQTVVRICDEKEKSNASVLGLTLAHRIFIEKGNCTTEFGKVYFPSADDNAQDVDSELGMAFRLSLDKLLCCVCGIVDRRMLWSSDSRFSSQFPKTAVCSHPFKPFSLYPMTYSHDMSFWECPGVEFDEMLYFCVIRVLSGETIWDVTLIDRYKDEDTGRVSRCYRLTFQSCDRALSYSTSWQIQSIIRLAVAEQMAVTLR
ncbi:ferredoxin-fold anticodon-binding domain-containing protein 1 homolog [Liolophura sinensis]|uniref:ferredoxin-fold anticodon-binding domain-containing protein 1 homolog n=1 Tax=Liolophura sinensis TaxID=3198878 RepID=UPI0031590D61